MRILLFFFLVQNSKAFPLKEYRLLYYILFEKGERKIKMGKMTKK